MNQRSLDQEERMRLILDATGELLVLHGYNKMTVGDVADAVGLHRGLVYLLFPSKDALVEALIMRELKKYDDMWGSYLNGDPLGGSVASVYRNVFYALKQAPLTAAILTRDELTFGKYLHRRCNLFSRLPAGMTAEFLRRMQDAGAVRREVNVAALACILDMLSPAILRTFSASLKECREEIGCATGPSSEELIETFAEMIERMVTPVAGANLEAGRAIVRQGLDQAKARFNEE